MELKATSIAGAFESHWNCRDDGRDTAFGSIPIDEGDAVWDKEHGEENNEYREMFSTCWRQNVLAKMQNTLCIAMMSDTTEI